jgi:hypothetical protein
MRKLLLIVWAMLTIIGIFISSCQNSTTEGILAIPGAPGKVLSENNDNVTEIPFELFGMNPMIHAKMNGKDIKLLIDNGSLWDQIWFYNGEVDSIGLKYKNDIDGEVTGEGEDGGTVIREGLEIDLRLGDLSFMDQPTFISVPEAGYDQLFPGINGQISSMIFKHFIVQFDFDRMIISLIRPEAFTPSENSIAIPMTAVDYDSYCIPIKLGLTDGNNVSTQIMLDIGTIAPLYLRYNAKKGITIPENTEKEYYGHGASGAIYAYQGMVSRVDIGKYSLYNVPTVFEEEKPEQKGTNKDFGLLGLPVMMKFHITFDYFHNVLYLEPNKSFHSGFIQAD